MAQVVYEDPIHHLSGKISKKYRTCYNYPSSLTASTHPYMATVPHLFPHPNAHGVTHLLKYVLPLATA